MSSTSRFPPSPTTMTVLLVILTLFTHPASANDSTSASKTKCQTNQDCARGNQCSNGTCQLKNENTINPSIQELQAVGLDPNTTSLEPRDKEKRKEKNSNPVEINTTSRNRPSQPLAIERPSSNDNNLGTLYVGAQALLIKDKPSGCIRLQFHVDNFAVSIETNLVFSSHLEQNNTLNSNLTALHAGCHVLYKILFLQKLATQVGIGLEGYSLNTKANGSVSEFVLPIMAEMSAHVTKQIKIFFQTRFYGLSTSGLKAGENRIRESTAPFLFASGIDFSF